MSLSRLKTVIFNVKQGTYLGGRRYNGSLTIPLTQKLTRFVGLTTGFRYVLAVKDS